MVYPCCVFWDSEVGGVVSPDDRQRLTQRTCVEWAETTKPTVRYHILSLVMDFKRPWPFELVSASVTMDAQWMGPFFAGLSPALLLECFGAALPLAQHSRPWAMRLVDGDG